MEKNFKNQEKELPKNQVQIHSSLSFSSLSNNNSQFRIENNIDKYPYDIKSNSSGSSELKTSNIIKYSRVLEPFQELSKINNVIIKIEYNSFCCLNHSNNLYHVFFKNRNDLKYLLRGEELMACTDDYSCCDYIQNPFSLKVQQVLNLDNPINVNINENVNVKELAIVEKSCVFPCFCFCRPEYEVRNSNNKIIGRIVLPFSFGDTRYKIYDDKDKLKYIIDTEYCQPGILYPKNCCGYLPDVCFDIYSDNNENERIGSIERKPGEYREFMYVLDCYQIFFPKNSTFEDKFLLICSVFSIEKEIFRDKWGTLNCCECSCICDGDGDCNEYCLDCCYRCCAELCSSCFRC